MGKKRYLIACLDNDDKEKEMQEIYSILSTVFFPRSRFEINRSRSLISNGSLEFLFRTPSEIQCLDNSTSFSGVDRSSYFYQYASYDSKTGYKYFEKKLGKVGKNGILKKLSIAREQ